CTFVKSIVAKAVASIAGFARHDEFAAANYLRCPPRRLWTVESKNGLGVALPHKLISHLPPINIPQAIDILKTKKHCRTFAAPLRQDRCQALQFARLSNLIQQ